MITRRKILQACTVPGAASIAGCGGVPFPFFDQEAPGRLLLRNEDDRAYEVTVTITSQDDGFERVDEYELEPESRRTIEEWLTDDGVFAVEATLDTGRSDETEQVEGGRGTCRIWVSEGSIAVTWQEGD